MRVVKLLLKSLLIIFLVVVVGGLIAREAILALTLNKLETSLKLVREVALNQTKASECMSRGSLKDDNGWVHRTQLRFIDDHNYVIEAVCNQFELSPIEVDHGSIPFVAKKERGVSGVVWGTDSPGLNLTVLNRVGQVFVDDKKIINRMKLGEQVNFHPGPVSQCASFGYECCDAHSQAGTGQLKVEVLDCPKSCYQSCQSRPLVLGFNTQPYFDKVTRQLEIGSNQQVVFTYTVSPSQEDIFNTPTLDDEADFVERVIYKLSNLFPSQAKEANQLKVTIDYGDGESETLTGLRGHVQHIYTCAKPRCLYQATIVAKNHLGVNSIQDLDSSIKILVK